MGAIEKHNEMKYQNPTGGVSSRYGKQLSPLAREFIPQRSANTHEDFVGGVCKQSRVNHLQSEVTPEVHDLSPDVKTEAEKQAFPLIGLSKWGSVRQEGNDNFNCSVVVDDTTEEKNSKLDLEETETSPTISTKFTLPTPNTERAEGCDGLQGRSQVKGSNVGMPTNTVSSYKIDTTEEEEYQRGFTFGFISIPHLYLYQAEERGSVMDFKYLSQRFEPHNPVQAMIMYIWFGAGSVPWIGQGKYVLA